METETQGMIASPINLFLIDYFENVQWKGGIFLVFFLFFFQETIFLYQLRFLTLDDIIKRQ